MPVEVLMFYLIISIAVSICFYLSLQLDDKQHEFQSSSACLFVPNDFITVLNRGLAVHSASQFPFTEL